MAYAKLNDRRKFRALLPFLQTIDNVEGVVCCVAINKALPSFFDADGTEWVNDPLLDEWRHWKPAVFERMLRAASIVALLAAGLSEENQEVGWVTDEDEIAANDVQLDKLCKAFGGLAGGYSSGRIKSVRCMTTGSGNVGVEDLASIADLAAGGMAELFTRFHQRNARVSTTLTLVAPDDLPGKALEILGWLRVSGKSLRRLIFVVEPSRVPGDADITEVLLS